VAEIGFPTTLTIDEDALIVDGVRIAWRAIPELLFRLAHPDPRKWYRWEREGDTIQVHVKISEESNGSHITSIPHAGDADSSSKGSG
jgi:hypothetical protein